MRNAFIYQIFLHNLKLKFRDKGYRKKVAFERLKNILPRHSSGQSDVKESFLDNLLSGNVCLPNMIDDNL